MRTFLIALVVTFSLSSLAFAQDTNQLDTNNKSVTSDISAAFNLAETLKFAALPQAEMAETTGGPTFSECWYLHAGRWYQIC